MLITDNTFYNYRQREGYIMYSLVNINRLKLLLYIANKLANYTASYIYMEDKQFKSWLWTDIFRLYSIVFGIISQIKVSSFILPGHYLYALPKIYRKLDKNARITAKNFYISAKRNLGIYLYWRNHPAMKRIYEPQKQCPILLYNCPKWITIPYNIIPRSFYVTTDRKYLQEADAVIFHMPDLYDHLDNDLDKPDNQVWIAWFGKEDECVSFFQDEELSELFDINMTGYKDIDVQYMKEENDRDMNPSFKSLADLCKLL